MKNSVCFIGRRKTMETENQSNIDESYEEYLLWTDVNKADSKKSNRHK